MLKWELNIVGSLLLFLAMSSCQKKADFVDIEIIGHAGNGLQNPNTFFHDNTMQSIEMALSTNGCDGVEVDVQLSLDGTLWLYHDEFLEAETNGDGCIAEKDDAYLRSLSYATIHKEKLVELSELPDAYLNGRVLYIDARHLNVCSGNDVDLLLYINKMNDFRAAHPSISELIICTGSSSWLNAFKLEGYTVMTQAVSIEHYQSLVSNFPQLDGVVSANEDISKEDVSLIHADGREVVIFNARSARGTRKAFKKLPDALMTDNITNALIEKY